MWSKFATERRMMGEAMASVGFQNAQGTQILKLKLALGFDNHEVVNVDRFIDRLLLFTKYCFEAAQAGFTQPEAEDQPDLLIAILSHYQKSCQTQLNHSRGKLNKIQAHELFPVDPKEYQLKMFQACSAVSFSVRSFSDLTQGEDLSVPAQKRKRIRQTEKYGQKQNLNANDSCIQLPQLQSLSNLSHNTHKKPSMMSSLDEMVDAISKQNPSCKDLLKLTPKNCVCRQIEALTRQKEWFQCKKCLILTHAACLQLPEHMKQDENCPLCWLRHKDISLATMALIGGTVFLEAQPQLFKIDVDNMAYRQLLTKPEYDINVRFIRISNHRVLEQWPAEMILKCNERTLADHHTKSAKPTLLKRHLRVLFSNYDAKKTLTFQLTNHHFALSSLRSRYIFSVGLYLVKKTAVSQIFTTILSTLQPASFHESTSFILQSNPFVGDSISKAMDKIVGQASQLLVRGTNCSHSQGFLLLQYLSKQCEGEQARDWLCPLCQAKCIKFNLVMTPESQSQMTRPSIKYQIKQT